MFLSVRHCLVISILIEFEIRWFKCKGIDVRLPICKWLVAKEPIPLSVPGIADGVVRVQIVGGVVCVEAGEVIRI